VLGTIIHLTILIVLVEFIGFPPVFSSSISFIVTLIVSYILNYKWAFEAKTGHHKTLLRYLTVCFSGFSLNLLIIYVAVHYLGTWYLFGQMVSIVFVPINNFILNSRWTFR